MKALKLAALLFLSYSLLAIVVALWQRKDFRTADRSSARMAPAPEQERRAVVLVYRATAFSWRGWFACHTWLAVKDQDAPSYEVLEVIGWRLRRGLSAVFDETDIPDRLWFGAKPHLLLDLRGPRAAAAIPKIRKAAAAYPYPNSYRVWPGPNSNTFTSFVLRSVPELGVTLPSNAIGRDWLAGGRLFSRSESGTGFQVSLLGLAGFTVGLRDGVEVQLLGLDFGLDLLRPALKLPLVGRLGVDGPLVVDQDVEPFGDDQGQERGLGQRGDGQPPLASVKQKGQPAAAKR